jgi:uncharacterized membrane protein YhaH (DUF805 family)
MGFTAAIGSGFSNYAVFAGRATRPAYWYFVLFCVLAGIGVEIVDFVIGSFYLGLLWNLVTLLPSLALAVRRLHDLDRSGWWLFIGLVPLVGVILLLVWFCNRGTPGPNRFG